MTKTKSAILVVAAFAAASVPLVLQHQSNQQLANTNRELLRRVAAYEEQIAPLRAENARLSADLPPFASPSNELLRLRDEVTRLREDARKRGNNSPLASSSDPLDQTLHSLGQRAARLREAVNRMPHLAIPELAYLKEKDWIDAVQYTEKLETDEEIRAAYNHLRSRAKVTVGIHLQSALKSYVEQNNQTLPNKLEDLVPFLSEPLPAEILARYQLTAPPGIAVTDLQDHNRFLIEEIAPPVDDEFDTHVKFSFHGVTTRSFNRADDLLKAAIEKFAAANNGLLPRDSGRLAGYLAEPVNAERIQKFLDKIPPHVTTFNQLKKD